MKKKLLFLMLLVELFLPGGVCAASISNLSVSAPAEVTYGSKYSVTFRMDFNGIEAGKEDTSGLYVASIALKFDEDVLGYAGISSPGFKSELLVDNEKNYYILSTLSENNRSNLCYDQVLYCGSYTVTLDFYPKKNTNQTTEIKVLDAAVAIAKVNADPETDSEMLEYEKEITRNVTIKEKQNNNSSSSDVFSFKGINPLGGNRDKFYEEIHKKQEEALSELTKDTPSEKKEPSGQTQTQQENKKEPKAESEKSSNNRLQELKLENYEINFSTDVYEYEITAESTVESIKVAAKAEDTKATCTIIGNDPLGDEIKITVKAENGEEQIYKVRVIKDASKEDESYNKAMNRITRIVLLSAGGIGIIIMICVIISRKSKKKLDKLFRA